MRYLLLILLLTSCGPKWHFKRALYHERMAIAKGGKVKTDTLYKSLQFTFPGIKANFGPKVIHEGQTGIYRKDSVITRVIRLPGDSIYVETDCPPTTVIKRVPYAVDKKVEIQSGLPWWIIPLCLISGFILACGMMLKRSR